MEAENENKNENKTKTDAKRSFWSTLTFDQKMQYIWNNITLEPLVLCFVMPSMLLMLGTQNLNLEKACRVNLGYNDTVCDALTRRDTMNYSQ